MTDLTEATLESFLTNIRAMTAEAGSRITLRPTQMWIPPDTVSWLDEVAPPGWRERIKAWKPGDNLIAIIFNDAGANA